MPFYLHQSGRMKGRKAARLAGPEVSRRPKMAPAATRGRPPPKQPSVGPLHLLPRPIPDLEHVRRTAASQVLQLLRTAPPCAALGPSNCSVTPQAHPTGSLRILPALKLLDESVPGAQPGYRFPWQALPHFSAK